jgi:hypothetical protein
MSKATDFERVRMLTLCPICRLFIPAIQERGKTNPLPAPHPEYHQCRAPETPEEQTVLNYMSIGRMLLFERFGFWPPVEEKLYELCPPSTPPLSASSDPSLPSAPPSKHSIPEIDSARYPDPLRERDFHPRNPFGFAPPTTTSSKEVK